MSYKEIQSRWQQFINEQEEPMQREQTAAIVWNNSNYRPGDKKILSKIPEILTPEWLRAIPQGHAGIILLKSTARLKGRQSKGATMGKSLDFAVEGSKTWRDKTGIFVPGQVRGSNIKLGYNFFDYQDESELESNIIEILNSNAVSSLSKVSEPNQFGYIPDINYEAALSLAGAPGTKKPYNIVPHAGGTQTDNCGSYALKVAAAGKGMSPPGVVGVMPDQVIGILADMGIATLIESF